MNRMENVRRFNRSQEPKQLLEDLNKRLEELSLGGHVPGMALEEARMLVKSAQANFAQGRLSSRELDEARRAVENLEVAEREERPGILSNLETLWEPELVSQLD